jgi:hypothetical protein
MFCKECGKKIDDDSHFCSYCGTKIKNNFQLNTTDTESSIVSSEFCKLLSDKIELMPKILTNRGYIYSEAIFLCENNLYDIQTIKSAFSYLWQSESFISNEGVPEIFKTAITYAISDYKNISEGDYFFVAITETRRYLRSINCIVQVFNDHFEYIIGIVHHY